MRIGFNFHSNDNYISGVEYYSIGLLRGLLDIDRQNQYIVFTNNPGLVSSYISSRDNLIVRDCSFLKNRLRRILWEHLRLASIAKKENIDVLHCPHYICPVIRSSAAYVTTIHDTIAIDRPDWCKKSNAAYYGRFMEKSVKMASRITAVSKFTADRISHNFNVNGSKVKVVYPGIDIGIFNLYQDTEKQNHVRAKHNLPENYILYSGNIEPKKNILNLLRAFRLLRNNGTRHSLVISGQRDWKSENVFDFLRKKFRPDEVILTGYIDRSDIGYVYKMADCLLLPSFCEGFGFPALEAFACGLPVAASRVGILQEIDKNSYTNLEPHAPEQMAESINKLLTDYKLRDLQIKTALAVVKKFNWSDCAAKTLAIYREVIEANGGDFL
jgi:glycosyltransferase involved in cell wall biosynthesis